MFANLSFEIRKIGIELIGTAFAGNGYGPFAQSLAIDNPSGLALEKQLCGSRDIP
ncbi:hypothetical protein Sj15T_09600 [Sphingobium sp. TA15]|uniref:hypothetical protein n=1 Tax=Sphingobium TaxID=165695 RepID=UPI0012B585C6|nr:hypothetical protein [Sphingobium indicum]BDD65939.1 hypothetical protein Sj15T_09600 [Sphingobium sp. TA15]